MQEQVKKRRKKGPAAIGDINVTKVIATSMIEDELKERQAKTQRLRELRLSAGKDEAKVEINI